ncbi:MAG: nucleotide-binding protein [Solirubrobacteraceae bacterium]
MTGYLGMDLPRFVTLVRARRWLIAGIVVAAASLALVASLLQSSRYRAGADLLFGQTTNADAIVTGATTDTAVVPERAAATNLALASLDTVAARVKQRVRGPVTEDQLRNAVSIAPKGQSDVVTVTAEWSSPRQAAAIANAFAAEIVALRRETAQADIQHAIDSLNATLPPAPAPGAPAEDARTRTLRDRVAQLEVLKTLQTGGVHIVQAAIPPQHRSAPQPLRNTVIAGAVALVLALFLVVVLARFEDRLRDEDELADLMGATILSRIPDVGRARPDDVWASDQHPAFLEAFEFLRMNLQLMRSDGGGLVSAFTSANPGDGKTTVVAWLARSLALSEADVVAVDLDLRKPELHRYFDVSSAQRDGVLAALLEVQGEDEASSAGQTAGNDAQADVAEPEAVAGSGAPSGRRLYTGDDVAAGLHELARVHGNVRRAARSLKGAGREVSESTLRRWKESHASLYAEMRAARIHGTMVAPHLRLLAGGNHPQLPTGMIAKGRLQQLFATLRLDADYVLADTVPVSTVADASAVAAAADGVILVVDLERARRRDLLATKKQLANVRAEIIGIVINRASVDLPPYAVLGQERGAARGPTGG